MARWKVGDVVAHKSTGECLLVLCAKEVDDFKGTPAQRYIVRLPNYQTAELGEFELEPVKISTKIQDARD